MQRYFAKTGWFVVRLSIITLALSTNILGSFALPITTTAAAAGVNYSRTAISGDASSNISSTNLRPYAEPLSVANSIESQGDDTPTIGGKNLTLLPSAAAKPTPLPTDGTTQLQKPPSPQAAFEARFKDYVQYLQEQPKEDEMQGKPIPTEPEVKLGEIKLSGAWAYALVEEIDPQDHAHTAALVGYYTKEKGWLVLAPGLDATKEYNTVLNDFPNSLLAENARAYFARAIKREIAPGIFNFSGYKLPWSAGVSSYISRRDGDQHTNQIDFDIQGGSTNGNVYATKPGTVVFVKQSSDYGGCTYDNWQQANMVVIQHGANEYSWYVHLAYNSVSVSVGQSVSFGARLGVESATGYACGVHLHYMTSTGHTSWTNPNDPNALPWATDIIATDFVEGSWNGLNAGQWYTSQNNMAYQVGEGSSQRAKFEAAFNRNGGSNAFGSALNTAHDWGRNSVQDFSGDLAIGYARL